MHVCAPNVVHAVAKAAPELLTFDFLGHPQRARHYTSERSCAAPKAIDRADASLTRDFHHILFTLQVHLPGLYCSMFSSFPISQASVVGAIRELLPVIPVYCIFFCYWRFCCCFHSLKLHCKSMLSSHFLSTRRSSFNKCCSDS